MHCDSVTCAIRTPPSQYDWKTTQENFIWFFTFFLLKDNPEQEVLYLVRGLLNILNGYSWDPASDTKIHIYINMLVMLSAMSQEDYIYHMDKGTRAPIYLPHESC